jgi:hypothetical protein
MNVQRNWLVNQSKDASCLLMFRNRLLPQEVIYDKKSQDEFRKYGKMFRKYSRIDVSSLHARHCHLSFLSAY